MSLHYLVKYQCQKTGSNLKYSIAKHLSYDGLLHYKFVSHCASKRIFKIREHLAKFRAKWLIASYAPFALRLLSSKMQNSLDKLNILFITDRNCYRLLLC